MATTLSYGATTITLPDDLFWQDEYEWHPVAQRVEYTIAGAVVVESGARLTGRPLTLGPAGENCAWMSRTTVELLRTAAAIAGQQFTLLYRGISRTVMFRHHDGQALEARPLMHWADAQGSDNYLATLRLMEI